MPSESYLIVEQISAPFEELPELLRELAGNHQLDSYQCRQLLLGPAQALLARGAQDELTGILSLLNDYEIEAHLFSPSAVAFSPFLLTHIDSTSGGLVLGGRDKSLTITGDSRLLVLLADLSGQLVARSLGQLLSSQRYRGRNIGQGILPEKQQLIILQGHPVLDIYQLDEEGRPFTAVRALAGKFDHRGLGEQASLSAGQNLLKLAELAMATARLSRLDMGFGLSSLPNAGLHPEYRTDPEGLKKNLRNLTRYAWLQSDIDRQRARSATPAENELSAATIALLSAADPAGAVAARPLVEEIAAEFSSAAREKPVSQRIRRTPLKPAADLPPPPETQYHSVWTSPKALASMAGFGLLSILTQFSEVRHWLGPLLKNTLASGGISGLLALGLYAFAFQRLKLKRLIQNTSTSRIRSIAMGLVEIKGTARRQFALISPMTHSACIFYRLTRYKRNNKNDWVVSSITSSGQVPFWVEDDTGRVSVHPWQARVTPGQRLQSFDEGGAVIDDFSSPDEKWVEELIYDGALVYVLGEARPKDSPRPGKTRRRAEALQQIKRDPARLAKYDADADGRIDQEEWQAATDEINEQLLQEDLESSSERRRQEDQVIIAHPRRSGLPFVIAETHSEDRLTFGYNLSIGVMFSLALILTCVTAWLFWRQL